MLAGLSVMSFGSAITVTAQKPSTPLYSVARITAVPACFAVSTPFSTDAIVSALLTHSTIAPALFALSVQLSSNVSPSPSMTLSGTRVSDSGAAFTVNATLAFTLPTLAVMVASPTANALTSPFVDTAAAFALLLA